MPLMSHILSRNGFQGSVDSAEDSPRKMMQPCRTPSSLSSRSTCSLNSSASSSGVSEGSTGSSCAGEWNQNITSREIYKSGKLKLLQPDRKIFSWPRGEKSREEPYYCLFCIHDEAHPFLELYADQRTSCTHCPLKVIPLIDCQHVSPNIDPAQHFHSFTLTLAAQSLQFSAGSHTDMQDWISTIRTKLQQLQQSFEGDKHAYTRCPLTSKSERLLSTPTEPILISSPLLSSTPEPIRSRTSSRLRDTLPKHPDPLPSSFETESIQSTDSACSSPPACFAPPVPLDPSPPMPPPIPPRGVKPMRPVPHPLFPCSSQVPPPPPPRLSESCDFLSVELVRCPPRPAKPKDEASNRASRDFYDVEALMQSVDTSKRKQQQPAGALMCLTDDEKRRNKNQEIYGTLFDQRNSSSSAGILGKQLLQPGGSLRARRQPPPPVQQLHKRETRSQTASPALSERSDVSTASSPSSFSPRECVFFGAAGSGGSMSSSDREKMLTLRQQQVMRLKQEMMDPQGVRVKLRRNDCLTSLALVDCFGCVWIAGWKQREHPDFHSRFRLGDQVIAVNGIFVAKAADALRLVQDAPQNRQVVFTLNRLPRARVLILERQFDGQDLGLIRVEKTAEIKTVVQEGLAAKQGLSIKAITCDGNTLCNWVLTEVNHRPLNWYFKEGEIDDRLRAVGKEISILVQPSDLVNAIKKQLKTLRNYKDYIVQ